MIAWLIGLPILAVTAVGTGLGLRWRPRMTLQALKILNLTLLVGAAVLFVVALMIFGRLEGNFAEEL